MTYGTTKEQAEAHAADFNKRDPYYDPNRPTEDYVVRLYSGTKSWGIVRRWRYADRKELGVFGGAFIWLG